MSQEVEELWARAHNSVTKKHLMELAEWRGWLIRTCQWFHERHLIGRHRNSWAFPNRDADGEVVSLHCRIATAGKKANWFFDPKGTHVYPFVVGDPEKAERVAIYESQWDLGSHIDLLNLELSDWAFIATRGAAQVKTLQGVNIPDWTKVYLLPQSDTAGKKWTNDVAVYLHRPVHLVWSPEPHKDLNDWRRNGATPAGLEKAIREAEIMEQRAPAKGAAYGRTNARSEVAAELEEQARKIAESSDAYYDMDRKEFIILTPQGVYQTRTETQFRRDLRFLEVSADSIPGRSYSQVDVVFRFVQHHRFVTYSGPLAGYRAGLYTINSQPVLVTQSPRIIRPQPGEFPLIGKLLLNMFGEEQNDYFIGWLKIAYESLVRQHIRTGHAIVLTGPRDCGKSLVQNLIITPVLGGRAVNPYPYMSGLTAFNGHCFEAEHQLIEDDVASSDIRSRRIFGSYLKQFTANTKQHHHAKYRQAQTLTPFWRVSISCNDEPENLSILPIIDESLADKIMLFQVKQHELPIACETIEEREALEGRINNELPAFLNYLRRWEIPEEMRDRRFGIRTYQNPEVLAALDNLAPETQLLHLIDMIVFKQGSTAEWEGKAIELEIELKSSGTVHLDQVKKLLAGPKACGTYLSRLAHKSSPRVQFRDSMGYRVYTISAP